MRVEKLFQGFKMQCPKKLLNITVGSQIANDFVWKSKAVNQIIYIDFCQVTFAHNLICKD